MRHLEARAVHRKSINRNVHSLRLFANAQIGANTSMLRPQKQPPVLCSKGKWQYNWKQPSVTLTGSLELVNNLPGKEVFVTSVSSSACLLSANGSLYGVEPAHPNGAFCNRSDAYWAAYIIKPGEYTVADIKLTISCMTLAQLWQMDSAWICFEYVDYGPHGRRQRRQHVVLPLRFPDPMTTGKHWEHMQDGLYTRSIQTHLLSHIVRLLHSMHPADIQEILFCLARRFKLISKSLGNDAQDDPARVVAEYAMPHSVEGDTVVVGETPLAIMQGQYRHPDDIRPSWLSKLLCKLFHPTSSMATACGMQALVDIVGSLRVFFAVFVAAAARVFGKRGVFYMVAGEQSRLIDDVTGSLPPYDQFILYGPRNAASEASRIAQQTGLKVAIADVNDLTKFRGDVAVLGASEGVDYNELHNALLTNPAGNGDEQTPLVLVRKRPL